MKSTRLPKVGSLSIGRALLALTTVFILTLFGILLYTIMTIQNQELDGVTVDLAGRQRMFNQKHMKEVLLNSQGLDADYTFTRNILNRTLDALMFGGDAVVDLESGEMLTLPPAPTPQIFTALREQKVLMAEFTRRADIFLQMGSVHPDYDVKLAGLLALNARLNDVANKAVKLFSRHSQEKISNMIFWELLIGGLAGFFGVLMTRQVRLANRELEHEIQERSRIETALRHRIDIENLVTNLSTQFINLQPKDLDGEINRALEAIGRFEEVDRSYVFLFTEEGRTLNRTHEWCRSGNEPPQSRLQNIFLTEWPWFEKQILSHQFIQISSVNRLPLQAAPEKQEFQRQGIQSLLNVPIVRQGVVVGFLGFDSVEKEKNWSEEDIRLLHMAGEIFVNGIERKRVEEDLRKSEAEKVEAYRHSDALKTALLSLVSHELRTPLTAIKASVAGLLGLTGPGTAVVQKEFLQSINQEIDFLNTLVDNLLNMSRVEAGTLGPHSEWHLLEDLLEGAIRRLELALKNRILRVDLGETMSPIYVDGMEIQQVLINLLDNAIKYSPPESVISILASRTPQQLEVRISNEGEGIPQEELFKIFERFYRLKGPQARLIRGTGLGLAICKGIIEAHGGHIWAESVEGQGVTMAFILPIPEPPPVINLERSEE